MLIRKPVDMVVVLVTFLEDSIVISTVGMLLQKSGLTELLFPIMSFAIIFAVLFAIFYLAGLIVFAARSRYFSP